MWTKKKHTLNVKTHIDKKNGWRKWHHTNTCYKSSKSCINFRRADFKLGKVIRRKELSVMIKGQVSKMISKSQLHLCLKVSV